MLFLPYQLQPNRVPVNLWVKEKKKWSKKTQPAAVLSKKFTLYKAAKVSLCLGDVQYMDGYGCRCVFGVVCGVNKQVLLKVPCVHTAHVLCSCVYSDVLLCTLYTSTLYPTTVCMYICMYVCTYICVYVCTYICVCVCTYICVHKVWTFTILPFSHGVCLPCLPHPLFRCTKRCLRWQWMSLTCTSVLHQTSSAPPPHATSSGSRAEQMT